MVSAFLCQRAARHGTVVACCPARSNASPHMQADLEKIELVDLDQIDSDERGVIAPAATGLAAELRRNYQASIEAEVEAQLADREAELRATMQACAAAFP